MKRKIESVIDSFLEKKGEDISYIVEYPKVDRFGDYSTNMAMILASKTGKNSSEVATEFISFAQSSGLFEKIEVAGKGFINFFIKKNILIDELKNIIIKGNDYFKPNVCKKFIQVEFVSANPTGPLHIGHGRGAAIGDSIARILNFCGHKVEREYYINDAGLQMDLLGLSTFIRYKQLLGHNEILPNDGYKGEYLIDIAKNIISEYGETLLYMDEEKAKQLCKKRSSEVILNDIMNVLKEFRVKFDRVFNEKKLYETGELKESIDLLKEKGVIYEKDGALWFKSSLFGDDKDRVIRRSNGAFTYFATDVAYHRNKFIKRKFDEVIDVWGSDHHGYIKRVKSAVEAIGVNPQKLKVILVQIVNLVDKSEKISMSTRKGEFVELKDILDYVGVDAARFMFVSRSTDAHLDFDLELAKKQSSDNPVFYVQYAYARINSIFNQIKEDFDLELSETHLELLKEKEELDLIKSLIQFKEYIYKAYQEIEPYFITKGLLNIAEKFHRFYNKFRVIGSQKTLMLSRLLLIKAVSLSLKIGFDLIGVEAKKKM